MQILKANLDPEQLAAASVLDWNVLVLAGPGSGKTHLLTHRVAYLLRQAPTSPTRVLCLTFTVEAAKQMRRLISGLVPPQSLSRITVANFHQFAQELLRAYGHRAGVQRDFIVLSEVDRLEIVEDVLAGLGMRNVNADSVVGAIAKRKGLRDTDGTAGSNLAAETFERIFDVYESERVAANSLDFDDLIAKAVELLKEPIVQGLVRATYRDIEVDELQDTSLLQLEMLKNLYEPGWTRVLAVADDDQMIYEWRDARPETLVEFSDFFDAQTCVLKRNYRCPRNVIEVANHLLAFNRDPEEKALIPMRHEEGYVELSHLSSQTEQQDAICLTIATAYEKGSTYKSHAVLARQRSTLNHVKAALEDYEIPYLEIGDREFERDCFVRLLSGSLLFVASDAQNDRPLRRAITIANETLGSNLFVLNDLRPILETLSSAYTETFFGQLVAGLNMKELLDYYGQAAAWLKVTRFLRLAALAQLDYGPRDYPTLHRVMAAEFTSLLNRVVDEEDAVRLMTIHGAKGLQFPTVFIPDLSSSDFPNLYFNPSDELIAAERRLLFVGLTRTEDETYLSWADESSRGFPATASPFVEELETAAPDFLVTK